MQLPHAVSQYIMDNGEFDIYVIICLYVKPYEDHVERYVTILS
jgi:hypothetical protein